MSITSLTDLTGAEICRRLARGEVSAVEVTRAFLERLERVEPEIHAFLHWSPERALDRARRLDDDSARSGTKGRLHGLPVAVKDILTLRGMPCTCGSRILEGYVPPYDATVVRRLLAAGAVVLGKTNLDEFAMGSSTENSAYGPTRNPWARDRVPGGSSGGSAAAVVARQVPVALGTDTGGSVRQPAGLCGAVGLKPTYGRLSRYGLVAFASSLDQVGPLARSVEDAALLLGVMAGSDPRDSTSSTHEVENYVAELEKDVRGLRIGVPREVALEGMDQEVHDRYREAVTRFESLGVEPVEIDLPHSRHAVACYYLISTAEASSNLARYDGVRYGVRVPGRDGLLEMYGATREAGFGAEVKRRILLGTYVLSAGYYDAYYLKAQKVRTLIARDFARAFERVDAVALPTSPTPAFRLGDKLDDPLQMYLSDIFTLTANLTGLPGISVPVGLTRERLPLGFQLLGRHFEESTILRLAHALERSGAYPDEPPPL